jgi:mono/diheme cytochrome c family protein
MHAMAHRSLVAAFVFVAAAGLASPARGDGAWWPVTPPPSRSPAEQLAWGQTLLNSKGCTACHRTDGRALVGPPLDHIVGSTVKLEDGSTAKVDADYLRESIDNPHAKLVSGFSTSMPYLGLTGDEVSAVVAYLQSLPPAPPEPPATKQTMAERGRALVAARGCFACHGQGGVGGVPNVNAAAHTVPLLKTLAEKMLLDGASDVTAVQALLEKGPLVEQATPPFPAYPRFLAQYRAVRTKILEGGKPASEFPRAPRPPLAMPTWKGLVTDRDADALIAYLLTLQNWDE